MTFNGSVEAKTQKLNNGDHSKKFRKNLHKGNSAKCHSLTTVAHLLISGTDTLADPLRKFEYLLMGGRESTHKDNGDHISVYTEQIRRYAYQQSCEKLRGTARTVPQARQ
jgi:hypothetical protein